MTIRITVECHVDTQAVLAKLDDDRFWTFAAMQWHRLYRPFVPMRTGRLANQVACAPKTITHTAPYAAYQYNSAKGGGKHPLASANWDKAAQSSQMGALVSALQGYADGGGLNFDG